MQSLPNVTGTRQGRPTPAIALREELDWLMAASNYHLGRTSDAGERRAIMDQHRAWAAAARRRYRAATIVAFVDSRVPFGYARLAREVA